MSQNKAKVIIVGAGPAGLAAAWQLAQAGHPVIILESDPVYVGGLSRTINHNGFRFDIGGHRFFSKNSTITRWWNDRLPNDFVPVKRLSRILYRKRFFYYPLLPRDALFGLGLFTSLACIGSYLWRQLFPRRNEHSFEDWVVNRFGDQLYRIFFKTYTEKVWGMPCNQISADWASQRIKGLSLGKAILGALGFKASGQATVKTLIDEFEYPKFGAGMLWEKTRDEIMQLGGQIFMDSTVTSVEREGNRIMAVHTRSTSGQTQRWTGDNFIISMPLRDCVLGFEPPLAKAVQIAARQLKYRDFLLVALVLNEVNLFPDTWLYIHDPTVKVGRIQNYNNWGGHMVPNNQTSCLELEYFCNRDDALWQMSDHELIELAQKELTQLGLVRTAKVLDGCVVRVEKAYPVYDAAYRQNLETIRQTLATIENLQPVGRNGMHKYNNQDHSIMTGLLAAQNLNEKKQDVWRVNGDAEYLEETQTTGRMVPQPLSTKP